MSASSQATGHNCLDLTGLTVTTSITLAGWVKVNAFDKVVFDSICEIVDGTGTNAYTATSRSIAIQQDPDGTGAADLFRFFWFNASGGGYASTPDAITTSGVWKFIVLTQSGTTVNFYVGNETGALNNIGTFTADFSASVLTRVRIGSDHASTPEDFNGSFRGWRLWIDHVPSNLTAERDSATFAAVDTTGLISALPISNGTSPGTASTGSNFTLIGTFADDASNPAFGAVAATIVSASLPPSIGLPPTPRLFAGAAATAAPVPPRVLSTSAQIADKPPTPRLSAGFGQKAFSAVVTQDPFFATATFDPVPLPGRMPTLYAGVVAAAAAGVAAQISARPVDLPALPPQPALYAGSANDPSTIPSGGIAGAFLPDEAPQPAGPRLFTGFGQAAQKAVVMQDPAWGNATFDPPAIVLPSLRAGVATQPAIASVIAPHRSAPPVALPPTPALFAGFGQAAQLSVIVQDQWWGSATFDPVIAPPRPQLLAGFGQAAQVAMVARATVVPLAVLPPQPSSFVGVAPAATTSSIILATPAVRQAELPPSGSIAAGFGQPAQVATFTMAPLVAPRAELPPQGGIASGFGQAAQVAAVVRAAQSLPSVPFAQPALFSGFGRAAQVAAVLSSPTLPPGAELLLLPKLMAGAGQPAALPVPTIYAPTPFAPRVELPPAPSLRAGAGQAAQPPVILSAASSAPSVDLFVSGRLFLGFGQPTALLPPPVYSAPQNAPRVELPPLPLTIRGTGQAAQVAVVYSATRAPDPAALPPTVFLAPGAVPPMPGVAALVRATVVDFAALPPQPVTVRGFGQAAQAPVVYFATRPLETAALPPASSLAAGVAPTSSGVAALSRALPVDTATLPPVPVLVRGFGQPAQVATVLTPVLLLPQVDLPPQAAAFAGVSIPPVASVVRSAPPREAHLPPQPQIAKGFGFPSQVATVITIPYGTAEITKLPPQSTIFAGFGEAPPPDATFRAASRPGRKIAGGSYQPRRRRV